MGGTRRSNVVGVSASEPGLQSAAFLRCEGIEEALTGAFGERDAWLDPLYVDRRDRLLHRTDDRQIAGAMTLFLLRRCVAGKRTTTPA